MDMDRDFIKIMCRLMPNQYRIGLAFNNRCGCGAGYQDVIHAVWYCPEDGVARSKLCSYLRGARGNPDEEDIRDVLGRLKFRNMFLVCGFLGRAVSVLRHLVAWWV